MKQLALVTGGGSGIGRMTAIALAAANWQVVVCGRSENTLQETVNENTGTNGGTTTISQCTGDYHHGQCHAIYWPRITAHRHVHLIRLAQQLPENRHASHDSDFQQPLIECVAYWYE